MKKRVISLLLALVLALGLLPATAWAAEAKKISTPEQFAEMDANGNYILTEDITVSTPYAKEFSGTFDGDGYTITLAISSNGANYVGLFKKLAGGATIKNVITTGFVTVDTTAKNKDHVGGIAGSVNTYSGNIAIEKCQNKASITGGQSVGGILGSCTYSNGHSVSIIECANTGDIISKAKQAGGIVGSVSGGHTIQNCYNRGTITANSDKGGIAGFAQNASPVLEKCYTTGDVEVIGRNKNNVAKCTACYKLASTTDENIKQLGSPFVADENNINDGYPILSWQKTSGGGKPEPPKPGISISGTKTLWTVAGGNNATNTTLTISYIGMGDEKPAVTWGYPAKSDAAAFTTAENNSGALVVNALGKTGGTATVTATVTYNEESYSDSVVITVIPHITYVDIINPTSSVIAPGQTVEAKVLVGDLPYDEENYPKLTYQWYCYDTFSTMSEKLSRATEKKYLIPEEYSANRIQVEVACGGKIVSAHDQHRAAEVLSGDDALLAFDKAALTLEKLGVSSTTITAETTLTLPDKGGNGSTITWGSSDPSVIDPTTGRVTLPAKGEQKVTLTAKLKLNDSTGKLPREFTVKSKAAQAVDADKETLDEAASKLENMGALHPRFGKDSNVQTMVETRLANAGFSGVGVKFISAEPTKATAVQAASAISSIGGITYFYDDPNKTVNERTQWFDTYKAHFTLTCGSEARENVAVPVTVYWDVNRVSRVMTEEVLDRVTLPELTEENLNLPTVVEGKQWAKIVWTSSDPGIISDNGVVTRSAIDRQTVLTASFTFQRTNDVTGSEPPIVLYKTFEVTVKAVQNGADRNEQYQAALEGALSDPGLRDFVTGKKLTANENGVYTTVNDIQFPTTRDLKIDGKYTPVVITSSDTAVIETPDVANAARVNIYRPLPGEAAKTVTLTVKVLDRPSGSGRDYANLPVLAEKSVIVSVQPLTQAEIDAEIALMAKVKDAYWDGICNGNAEEDNITTDLHAFQECYLGTGGQLTWVYDRKYLKNHGIVPVPLDNWYDQQIWRLFRSSNADVVAHENLLVSRQKESKAVTVTSYLSSETLGKYAEKYPQNADFQKLYKQPVTIDLVVTGTQYAQGVGNTVRMQAAKRALAVRPTVSVSFALAGSGMGFSETKLKYAEGSTAFDVFSDMLAKHRYTCKRRGSYIASITSDGGKTLEEFDEGKNSGWMYRVNGELASKYMSAQGLKDGDRIEIYFTSDWTSEPGAGSWKPVTPVTKGETPTGANGSATKVETKPDGTVVETTTKPDGTTVETTAKPDGSFRAVEKRADGTTVETSAPAGGGITASVSVPKKVGSTRVDLPVSAPTGGMVAVLVHPDGTEEILKNSVVTDTGIAFRAEGTMQVRIADNANHFEDTQKHWAKEAVEFASARELFNGVSGSEFAPDLPMTRGMVNTVLARLAGVDTSGGEQWYTKGTEWAKANGISDGTNPEQEVTREQLAAMLYRYADSPAVSGALRFDDAGAVSDWAYAAVKWCAENGIMNGVGSNLAAPQGLARRGQVAAMLMRFLRATL